MPDPDAACAHHEILVDDVCMPCASSHFKANATACVACPDGFVQAENNASTCERCPVGQYWVRGEGCQPCDLGKGVPCEDNLFRDDCTRQLEQGQPCACACRLCPLVAEALGQKVTAPIPAGWTSLTGWGYGGNNSETVFGAIRFR